MGRLAIDILAADMPIIDILLANLLAADIPAVNVLATNISAIKILASGEWKVFVDKNRLLSNF